MAFTVTSTKATCVVTSTTAIAKVRNSGAGVYIYLTYTQNSESGIYISPSILVPDLSSSTYYQFVKSDSLFELTPLKYSITATGSYRIPIDVGLGETALKLTFAAISGAADGTIDVEIRGGE